jgi:predicted metal-binding protein
MAQESTTEKKTRHQLVVCTTCRKTGTDCKPGFDLLQSLNRTADLGRAAGLLEDFGISGTACLSGCSRPCTVAFVADGKTSYLFGDIDPQADLAALVEFAKVYRAREDGMTRFNERPDALRGKCLARIPSALMMSEATDRELV